MVLLELEVEEPVELTVGDQVRIVGGGHEHLGHVRSVVHMSKQGTVVSSSFYWPHLFVYDWANNCWQVVKAKQD